MLQAYNIFYMWSFFHEEIIRSSMYTLEALRQCNRLKLNRVINYGVNKMFIKRKFLSILPYDALLLLIFIFDLYNLFDKGRHICQLAVCVLFASLYVDKCRQLVYLRLGLTKFHNYWIWNKMTVWDLEPVFLKRNLINLQLFLFPYGFSSRQIYQNNAYRLMIISNTASVLNELIKTHIYDDPLLLARSTHSYQAK